jgi:hypothetical protein
MMWDVVIEAWLADVLADDDLVTALGGTHIYPAQAARLVRVPSVEWLVIVDREEELHNPITVQVDYWAKGTTLAATIERRIRRLTHRDVARVWTFDGVQYRLWTRYIDSRTHDYPADPGVLHRSLDYEFRPLREKYQYLHETL